MAYIINQSCAPMQIRIVSLYHVFANVHTVSMERGGKKTVCNENCSIFRRTAVQ